MDWTQLLGHQQQREWFITAIAKKRLGGAFLFVGPAGVGKRTFAKLLAKTLLCENHSAADFNPCGVCEGCAQVEAETHPDLLQVAKPADRAMIPVELLIGPRDARMQSGLCHDIYLRPFRGRRRVGIIQDADFLSIESANSMLKTLEEPPAAAVLILIGTSPQRQLPTIRSRCRTIRFATPRGEDALQLLKIHGVTVENVAEAEHAIALAGGDIHQAVALLQPDSGTFQSGLKTSLERHPIDGIRLARSVSTYVDEAGKDAPARRTRLREVFGVAVQFFRRALRAGAANEQPTDRILYRLNRSLDALNEIERNANQATLIETWAVDIQRGTNLPGTL
ncbi:DNA polymerase III subunit tau [Roseimaritima multifibrata]|uniref:DNA polymerase III subunit tau n=1 Tax=Roseimaritima multifibrata TaxID=1930274 RepID=A0A517MFC4_9BACT|nr:DNA polymerase III subunit delta' [Roseimaritima multifibrata]QDS93590.1 DNA polymerase III subunit tau [Roseimaritima multifibrata]